MWMHTINEGCLIMFNFSCVMDTYYSLTTNIMANQLRRKLDKAGGNNREKAYVWESWIMNWSKFSLQSFLQNT